MLQEMIYQNPHFREAGLIVNGKLASTNLRVYNPPTGVVPPEYTRLPEKIGGLAVEPFTIQPEGRRGVILTSRASETNGFFAIVDLAVLAERLKYADVDSLYAVYLVRADGSVLGESSNAQSVVPPPSTPLEDGKLNEPGVLSHAAAVGDYPLWAVAMLPKSKLLGQWFGQTPVFVIAGVFVAALLIGISMNFLQVRASPGDELREAIRSKQIEAYYHPMIELATGRCIGVEVLMRWRHPERGMIAPLTFLAEAEASGIITELTESLIQRVADELSDITTRAQPDIKVAFNISPTTLNDDQFILRVERLIGHKLNFKTMQFELTNCALLSEKSAPVLETIHTLGIELAAEDYGIGFSDINYLIDYPINAIKIDRSFVGGITGEEESSGLVDQVIAIGQACGLKMFAEGIEHEYQVEYLKRAGVEYGQGFLYARPMNAQQFRSWHSVNATRAQTRAV
jgi:sensor c-di-GMP phosphodiesterase-like protein